MSFEGFYRKLCKNGHLWLEDVNSLETAYCPVCGSGEAWKECIDTTNEYNEKDETLLEVVGFDKIEKVDDFGTKYAVKELKYKIPTKEISLISPEIKMVGYEVIEPFDTFSVGDIWYESEPDGITSYYNAPDKDSSSVPCWVCDFLVKIGYLREYWI